MLENQAFGWLKNAIKGSGASSSSAGSDAAAISACSDPAVLVKGVAEDFNAALLLSASSANNNNTASTNATSGSGGAGAGPINSAGAGAGAGIAFGKTNAFPNARVRWSWVDSGAFEPPFSLLNFCLYFLYYRGLLRRR